ncbi:MAG: hypothetical protein HQK57_12835 [Deltaproteobacteria bacterium]|nr:hypothetical protein [Deltaproteobacteria bacterium]MBF0525654.1 hypothetical protein [Deltaproteobacteria bacterium]
MGEGVDPTDMCQTLVEKVAQSKQLMAITDPELLVLFDDWFDELEEEVVAFVEKHGLVDGDQMARGLGLSQRGAYFIISKLKREGKI